jgi:hypothetical protein
MASDVRGFARGFFAVVAPTCGVLFVIAARVGDAIGVEVIAHFTFGVALLWIFVFFPYLATIPELFSTNGGFAFAFLQWAVVGTVVGLLTRHMSRWRALVWAVLAAIIVSVLTHALLRGLGYVVIVEGP